MEQMLDLTLNAVFSREQSFLRMMLGRYLLVLVCDYCFHLENTAVSVLGKLTYCRVLTDKIPVLVTGTGAAGSTWVYTLVSK